MESENCGTKASTILETCWHETGDDPPGAIETPCFVLELKTLDQGVQSLKQALNEYWPNSVVGYSVKTNSLPWLLDYFKSQAFHAEVVSSDEYQLARAIGFQPSRIVYNGLLKSKATFIEALNSGCLVNIDSYREIEWLADAEPIDGTPYQVGVRINFDLEAKCPGQTTMGFQGSRFGFYYENGELKKAIDDISRLPHVNLVGVHCHFSSKTRSLDIYRSIAQMCCQTQEAYKLDLSYVDIGGGFYGGLPDKPTFSDYLRCVSETLAQSFDRKRTKLVIEPGTSLVSAPFKYVSSVIDVKWTAAGVFVVTDGTRMDVDPLMRKTGHFYKVLRASQKERQRVKLQVVCGLTCIEDDRLLDLTDEELLSVGDRIVYDKVGAYTQCLAPLFINYFPAVYLSDGAQYRIIREKISAADYLELGRSQWI